MKIGILTSSRADFGIYLPLIKELQKDPFFQPEMIVFGAHLSHKHGYTINEIKKYGIKISQAIETLLSDDTAKSIAASIGKTITAFSGFWSENHFDLVLALGDRFEMFGAVTAGSVFNVKFAHIHAGETTLGAIDNAYRHSISLMSDLLFVTTEEYRSRAIQIVQNPDIVYNVGALSIDNLISLSLLDKKSFKEKYNIDLGKPTVLVTFHPETIHYENNEVFVKELVSALKVLATDYQIIITMPNADTANQVIREHFTKFTRSKQNVFLVESFGVQGYLSCMKHCSFLLGNSSSGFVEASFFPKWVINLGDRQKGRIITPNILNCSFNKNKILSLVKKIDHSGPPPAVTAYGDGTAAKKIVQILKKHLS